MLVNNGSGWQIDQAADEALGGTVPWAVAALPDGGAAVSATAGGLPGTATIIERDSAGSVWQAAPPYPGTEAPGSLALFREGGALRAIGSGGMPNTGQVEELPPPPAGFPPNLIAPYPLASGYVHRQTANGWSDEEHERNPVEDPLGEYKFYDQVFQPDPSAAVLINEAGTEGWAVGGFVNTRQPLLNTADVARYPATPGSTPPGVRTAPVQPIEKQAALNGTEATFAIGGDAACEAPCADRARAGIGPDAWLSTALSQAQRVAGPARLPLHGPARHERRGSRWCARCPTSGSSPGTANCSNPPAPCPSIRRPRAPIGYPAAASANSRTPSQDSPGRSGWANHRLR